MRRTALPSLFLAVFLLAPAPVFAENLQEATPVAVPAAPPQAQGTEPAANPPLPSPEAAAPAASTPVAEATAPDPEREAVGGTAPTDEAPPPSIADPLESVNRAFFVFNDKFYFWILKPASRGYGAVVPEGVRVAVKNFFSNLTTPIRLVNNLLQGKLGGTGTELLRFGINSTIGMAGFFDTAKNDFHIEKKTGDFGQTLGIYGLGHGAYVVWPILGPSSMRDTVGFVGDSFLDPVNYLPEWEQVAAVKTLDVVNDTSLRIGEYEDLKAGSVDPYVAVRDAYVQYREKQLKK